MNGRTKVYVGKCVECGASMYYNKDLEKIQVKGKMPGCLCHFDWSEDREEEEE